MQYHHLFQGGGGSGFISEHIVDGVTARGSNVAPNRSGHWQSGVGRGGDSGKRGGGGQIALLFHNEPHSLEIGDIFVTQYWARLHNHEVRLKVKEISESKVEMIFNHGEWWSFWLNIDLTKDSNSLQKFLTGQMISGCEFKYVVRGSFGRSESHYHNVVFHDSNTIKIEGKEMSLTRVVNTNAARVGNARATASKAFKIDEIPTNPPQMEETNYAEMKAFEQNMKVVHSNDTPTVTNTPYELKQGNEFVTLFWDRDYDVGQITFTCTEVSDLKLQMSVLNRSQDYHCTIRIDFNTTNSLQTLLTGGKVSSLFTFHRGGIRVDQKTETLQFNSKNVIRIGDKTIGDETYSLRREATLRNAAISIIGKERNNVLNPMGTEILTALYKDVAVKFLSKTKWEKGAFVTFKRSKNYDFGILQKEVKLNSETTINGRKTKHYWEIQGYKNSEKGRDRMVPEVKPPIKIGVRLKKFDIKEMKFNVTRIPEKDLMTYYVMKQRGLFINKLPTRLDLDNPQNPEPKAANKAVNWAMVRNRHSSYTT